MTEKNEDVEKMPLWKTYIFPPQVYLILGNELCERFCYYGLRTILTIYLSTSFGIDKSISVIIYHIFNTLAYFMPIFGAVLSDNFIGKYKTIIYLSIVYALGNILLAVTSIPTIINSISLAGPVISLILIAVGTGGIKPCVSAYGAEQFSEKDTQRLQKYFAIFYFCINIGALVTMVITPVIRSNIQCFGQECYIVAFGIPAFFFIVAFAFFLSGTKLYKTSKPESNVLLDVTKTTFTALRNKFKMRNSQRKHEHWMDYALTETNSSLIQDIKSLYKVLFLFIPLPIFWTLFDQQGSKWIFQALKMNGNIGSGIIVHADQLQAVNAGLVLLLIPVFDSIIYPLFGKFGLLKNLLHRMISGMVLVAVAFFVAAILEYKINTQHSVKTVAKGSISLRIVNAFDSQINVWGLNGSYPDLSLSSVRHSLYYPFSLSPNAALNISYNSSVGIPQSVVSSLPKVNGLKAVEGKSYTLKVSVGNKIETSLIEDLNVGIAEHGTIRLLFGTVGSCRLVTSSDVTVGDDEYKYMMNETKLDMKTKIGKQKITINQQELKKNTNLLAGAVYTLVAVINSNGSIVAQNFTMDVAPPSVHLVWQIPQHAIVTAGEILFSITGLNFAYREAPTSMKSCVMAAWLITTSVGNLIVVLFAEVKIVDDMAIEFSIYAFLLIITSVIFGLMAHQYNKQKHVCQRKDSNIMRLDET